MSNPFYKPEPLSPADVEAINQRVVGRALAPPEPKTARWILLCEALGIDTDKTPVRYSGVEFTANGTVVGYAQLFGGGPVMRTLTPQEVAAVFKAMAEGE